MHEALYYRQESERLRCGLCPHRCLIGDGAMGLCRTRKNIDGTLYAVNYGCCTAAALDPIEKKPLRHFHPGSTIFSIGSFGCNLRCSFCQNYQIAQLEAGYQTISPQQVIDSALALQSQGNIGIAYTYNEPGVWYEFVLACAKLAREQQLFNVLITNGYIMPEPLHQLLPYIDAMNIDVKAFTQSFYRDVCGGALDRVQQTVATAVACCHVEVTTLVVPGLNDKPEEWEALAKWLHDISPDIPLHLTRYFPNYQCDAPPTPVDTLVKARERATRYLHRVYIGNVPGM